MTYANVVSGAQVTPLKRHHAPLRSLLSKERESPRKRRDIILNHVQHTILDEEEVYISQKDRIRMLFFSPTPSQILPQLSEGAMKLLDESVGNTLKLVEMADDTKNELAELRAQVVQNAADNKRLVAAANEAEAMNILADTGSEICIEILKCVDQTRRFRDWKKFTDALDTEGDAIPEDIDYLSWGENAEILRRYELHGKVLTALDNMRIPAAQFELLMSCKRDRNRRNHFGLRRSNRTTGRDGNNPLDVNKIEKARRRFADLSCEVDREVNETMGTIFGALTKIAQKT